MIYYDYMFRFRIRSCQTLLFYTIPFHMKELDENFANRKRFKMANILLVDADERVLHRRAWLLRGEVHSVIAVPGYMTKRSRS